MNTTLLLNLLVLTGFLVTQPQLSAQDKSRYVLPDDPEKAWVEVEKVHQGLRAPDDWRTHSPTAGQVAEFQKQVCQTAVAFADKAREFIERFPTNENIGDARITVVHALTHAVAAGDAGAEKKIAAFVSAVLADAQDRLERLRKASGGQRKTDRKLVIRGQEQQRREGVSEEARTTYISCSGP